MRAECEAATSGDALDAAYAKSFGYAWATLARIAGTPDLPLPVSKAGLT